MTAHLLLYTRRECSLCDAMKAVIREVAGGIPLALEEIDVDSSPELAEEYGAEVPVLVINGRKAFKYRVAAGELAQRLKREPR